MLEKTPLFQHLFPRPTSPLGDKKIHQKPVAAQKIIEIDGEKVSIEVGEL